MFINSSNVEVFPSAKPRNNGSSRILYESNITNLVKQVVDEDSFIIKCPQTFSLDSALSEDIELNIYGYYFKIKEGAKLSAVGTNNYLVASIDLSNGDNGIVELQGQDHTDGTYTGLNLSTMSAKPLDSTTRKHLVIATKLNSGWQRYSDSCVKFTQDSIKLVISGIDGKRT